MVQPVELRRVRLLWQRDGSLCASPPPPRKELPFHRRCQTDRMDCGGFCGLQRPFSWQPAHQRHIIRSRHGGTVYAASNGPCAGDGAPCAHGILGTPSVTKKQTRVAVSCPAHCRPVVCDHKLRRHLGRRCVAGCPCIGGRDDANRAESGYGFGREAANCSPATGGKCDLSSRGGLKAPTARRWRQPWQGPAWGPMGMPMGGLPCLRRICTAQSCNNALCNAPQEAPFFTCRLRFHDGFPIIMKRRTKA